MSTSLAGYWQGGTGRASDGSRAEPLSKAGKHTHSHGLRASWQRAAGGMGGGPVQTPCNQAEPGPLSGEVLLMAGTGMSPAAGPKLTEDLTPHARDRGTKEGNRPTSQSKISP